MKYYRKSVEFLWDKGNKDKNWKKYHISNSEAEEPFFDKNKKEYPDPIHSQKETRKILIGKTKKDKILFIVYTKRNKNIRIISVRRINRKELKLYEKAA